MTPRTGGGLVHATSLTNPHRSLCNRITAGWKVAVGDILTCAICRDRMDLSPKRRKQ